MIEHIETARLILRSFVEADAEALSYLSTRPVVAHFMSDMVFPTEDAARGWIGWALPRMNMNDPCMVFAVQLKDEGKLIGYMGVAPKAELDGEIEILYAISDEYQGKGYATEAGKA